MCVDVNNQCARRDSTVPPFPQACFSRCSTIATNSHQTILASPISRGQFNLNSLVLLVPGGGVEPPRGCPRRILSPLRLPVPPSRLNSQLPRSAQSQYRIGAAANERCAGSVDLQRQTGHRVRSAVFQLILNFLLGCDGKVEITSDRLGDFCVFQFLVEQFGLHGLSISAGCCG